jgi:hypothetical protein
MIPVESVKGFITLALPSFLFHGEEDLTKHIDTEGRVLEPLKCGDHRILRETVVGIKNEGYLRVSDAMPIPLKGGRPKAFPTRPSVSLSGKLFLQAPHLGGSLGETSSAQPLWRSRTRLLALTGVPPVEASLSHSF